MNTDINQILNQCKRGNPQAQKALYRIHKVRWFMICLRYSRNKQEAEDMLQDGLIGVFKDLHQFDSRKANFATWSGTVMANAARQYLRKWKKLDFVDTIQEDTEQFHSQKDEIFNILSAKELTKLIQNLPTGYRVVFNMFAIEGFKHEEIATKLGISINTSKSQLFKAKKLLKKQLEVLLEY